VKPAPSFDGRTGSNLPHVFLYPGTMHCATKPSLVTTVLGSCVAVCLIDRASQLSGINHFLLPLGRDASSLRHGGSAIAMLLEEMLRLGARPETIEAKIFGGAAVLPVNNSGDAVGAKNVAVALKCLRALDIEVVARRTGGKNGMLIRLFTATGDVLVRRVASSTVEWPADELPFEFGRRQLA
jgi:chemotaxis protein CheD